MAVSFRGAIGFGMVYIPVGLYTATQDNEIRFNEIHKECKERIRRKKVCPPCNIEDVKEEDVVKGYEYEPNQYIIMTDDDFEKIKTQKDKTIHILQFADLSEIDPIYYEKTYYVVPEGGDKALELLKTAMKQENKIAVARMVLGKKEHLATLRVSEDIFLLETMFYADEIKAVPTSYVKSEINENELAMAKMLINNMTTPFQPENYHNEYQERIKQMIKQKIQGQEVVTLPSEQKTNVINLMEALEASLQASQPGQLTGIR